jgi:hypothetical protein
MQVPITVRGQWLRLSLVRQIAPVQQQRAIVRLLMAWLRVGRKRPNPDASNIDDFRATTKMASLTPIIALIVRLAPVAPHIRKSVSDVRFRMSQPRKATR